MSLLQLALELQFIIVDNLDDRADVLALSLTCRDFSTIIPEVLAWREIRLASIHRAPKLWRHIAGSAKDARKIRRIVVRNDEVVHAPNFSSFAAGSRMDAEGALEDEEEKEYYGKSDGYARRATSAFVAALAKMANLHSLTMGNHAFASDDCSYEIWLALLDQCHGLREITILPWQDTDRTLKELIFSPMVSE